MGVDDTRHAERGKFPAMLLGAWGSGEPWSASGVSESCSNGSSVSSGVMVSADVKQCRMDSVSALSIDFIVLYCM